MKSPKHILGQVERAAQTVDTWADLANFLFDPEEGLIARAYPTRRAREAFVRTREYKRIRQLLSSAIDRYGLVEGAAPLNKSGRFVVRLPKSLHAALEREASGEGVSLNQLVVAKLAVQLHRSAGQTATRPKGKTG
jgi:hypothetical protein